MELTVEQKQLALKARRAYQREWKRNNPEKVKAAQERHWLKKAQQMEQEAENEHASH